MKPLIILRQTIDLVLLDILLLFRKIMATTIKISRAEFSTTLVSPDTPSLWPVTYTPVTPSLHKGFDEQTPSTAGDCLKSSYLVHLSPFALRGCVLLSSNQWTVPGGDEGSRHSENNHALATVEVSLQTGYTRHTSMPSRRLSSGFQRGVSKNGIRGLWREESRKTWLLFFSSQR